MAQEAFINWVRQGGGVVNEKLDLFHIHTNTGRGVRALERIEKGELLLEIPESSSTLSSSSSSSSSARALTLSADSTPSAEFSNFLLEPRWKDYSPWMKLIFRLLHEQVSFDRMFALWNSSDWYDFRQSIGEKSAYYPYFAILPKGYNTPAFWSDEERILLRGTVL